MYVSTADGRRTKIPGRNEEYVTYNSGYFTPTKVTLRRGFSNSQTQHVVRIVLISVWIESYFLPKIGRVYRNNLDGFRVRFINEGSLRVLAIRRNSSIVDYLPFQTTYDSNRFILVQGFIHQKNFEVIELSYRLDATREPLFSSNALFFFSPVYIHLYCSVCRS